MGGMIQERPPSTARSTAWGLAAGLAASLCCLGPAASALLGLGASSALAGAQIGSGPAAALGLATFAAGVALALRRGAACGLSRAGRLRAPLVMLAAFALSYALLARALPEAAARQVAAASAPLAAQARPELPAEMPAAAPAALAQAPPEAPEAAPARRLTLSIEKMDCAPCVAGVRRLLSAQPGVSAFVAEQNLDEVTVDYSPAAVDAATLAALFPASYGVTLIGDAALP
jgi:copper chaperone CopZ